MFLKSRKRLPGQKGFIITEVLVTMLLIVITLISITPMLMMGIKSGKVSKARTVEMKIAQQEIERFNQDKFSSLLSIVKEGLSEGLTEEQANEAFAAFLNGEAPHKSYGLTAEYFVNGANGEIREAAPDDEIPQGFKRIIVLKNLSYVQGQETILDDAIQMSVQVKMPKGTNDPEKNNPVALSALLSRDKVQ